MKPRDYRVGRSGIRGASPLKSGKFASYIKRDGRCHYLGQFDTAEEANAAFLAAEKRMPRTGRDSKWTEKTRVDVRVRAALKRIEARQ